MYLKSFLFSAIVLGSINAALAFSLERAPASRSAMSSPAQSESCDTSSYLIFNKNWLETATWKDVYCKIHANLAKSYIKWYARMDFQIGNQTMFSAHWKTLSQKISESGDSYVDLYVKNREIIVLTHTKLQGSETELLPLVRERFRLDSEGDMKSLHTLYLSDNPWICVIPDLQGNAYQTLQNLRDLQTHIPYNERLSINIVPLIFFYNNEKEERARSPKEFKRMEQAEVIIARIFKNESIKSILQQCDQEMDAISNAPLTIQTVIIEER